MIECLLIGVLRVCESGWVCAIEYESRGIERGVVAVCSLPRSNTHFLPLLHANSQRPTQAIHTPPKMDNTDVQKESVS